MTGGNAGVGVVDRRGEGGGLRDAGQEVGRVVIVERPAPGGPHAYATALFHLLADLFAPQVVDPVTLAVQ